MLGNSSKRNRKDLNTKVWFQREIFEGTLLLIPLCALLYLFCQLAMGVPWIQLSYTFAVGIGCLVIRAFNRIAGTRAAHICFMAVILGLFIPSWLNGGGTQSSTRYFSVIFFLLHLVLFPTFRFIYVICIWMLFTVASIGLEYFHPDLVTGRFLGSPSPPPMLLEQLVVHFIVFLSCGLLLRHTINAFLRTESRLHEINRTQRDLLRITSHDLRGPVNNLQLGIEALLASLQDSNDSHPSSDLIAPDPSKKLILQLAPTLKLQVQHMDFLMRNLSYFRLDHNEKLTPFLESLSGDKFINQVVEGWRLHAIRKQLKLILIIPDSQQMIVTDRMFFKQILDNLISNALKYTSSDSEVKVIVTYSESDLFIDVCDQGTGINPKDQIKIFKCFERAGNPDRPREHSIGLGLWIVSLLSPLIHGEVTISQSDHTGSTFRLALWDVLIQT